MKDQRFIELLNLYIDRQINAAETAELETEIQQNPKRQAVYRQYCKIHTATKLVYASFRANASEQPVLPSDRTGVVELFEAKRRKNNFAYVATGLAAAACLALALVRYNQSSPVASPVVTARVEASVPAVAPAVAAPVAPVAAPAVEPEVGLVSLRNNATNSAELSAMLAVMREQDEERAMASGHLQPARIQPLFDDGLFNTNRATPVPDQRGFRIQPAGAQQVEAAAFQFQR
ncbi:MAG TPA: hypothetical protein VG734_19375 [Lacunisphaera sp.]|nr:hypothetical protein [Lacunisphaera sp.]